MKNIPVWSNFQPEQENSFDIWHWQKYRNISPNLGNPIILSLKLWSSIEWDQVVTIGLSWLFLDFIKPTFLRDHLHSRIPWHFDLSGEANSQVLSSFHPAKCHHPTLLSWKSPECWISSEQPNPRISPDEIRGYDAMIFCYKVSLIANRDIPFTMTYSFFLWPQFCFSWTASS